MPTKPGTYVTFKTTEGTIVCELFEADAPQTVANFIGLAEGTKDWNSRTRRAPSSTTAPSSTASSPTS